MAESVVFLYRPVGQAEYELVRNSDFREFPPRLPDQPFFYPVVHEEYAIQIARDWYTKDANSGCAGYVLKFGVRSNFLGQFDVHTVGSSVHQEYWVPASRLHEFNANIVGSIECVGEFRGHH